MRVGLTWTTRAAARSFEYPRRSGVHCYDNGRAGMPQVPSASAFVVSAGFRAASAGASSLLAAAGA